jgi:hypothetical protein
VLPKCRSIVSPSGEKRETMPARADVPQLGQVTNQALRNPIIKPIKGLEIANQSGIASCK